MLMGELIELPVRRSREPDAVRLGYDFGQWCCEYHRGGRFIRRQSFEYLEGARAEVERQAAAGLRRLPDGKPDPGRFSTCSDDEPA